MKAFEYLEPRTVSETLKLLSQHSAEARVLAGGVDLLCRMRCREIEPDYVLNISKIPELAYLDGDGSKGMRIGALATLRALELAPAVRRAYPPLWAAASQIGSVQVKHMGTAVGNICVGTPASDIAVALLALGAKLKVASATGTRTIPIEEFFTGVRQTALKAEEMVTELSLPPVATNTGFSFRRLVRNATDVAKVNVAVMLTMSDGACQAARISLGAVAPTVMRARNAEAVLEGQKATPAAIEQAAEAATQEVKPITDLRSTADYRRQATKVLLRRALTEALQNAQSQSDRRPGQ
ncbi:MAG: xanthine dehydrogenase family protein subunit M [Chloroflexi bacterium]|nr:xanthine dehydrogenase family protein subunit M [Chloroflexota bacterium]